MPVDVHELTVGPVQENCFIVRAEGHDAVVIDPGDEFERIDAKLDQIGAGVAAILITHCHFDHVGAVAPLAKKTGAEVWVPAIERPVLADIMSFVPWAGIGPFESYDAEHDVRGGERLELGGLQFDVFFTPGHSPGHVSYHLASEQALFSGDVLFQGSIGRTDLPGGDMQTLVESIGMLVEQLPGETIVFPGHMATTTLSQEHASNPFLGSLAR